MLIDFVNSVNRQRQLQNEIGNKRRLGILVN